MVFNHNNIYLSHHHDVIHLYAFSYIVNWIAWERNRRGTLAASPLKNAPTPSFFNMELKHCTVPVYWDPLEPWSLDFTTSIGLLMQTLTAPPHPPASIVIQAGGLFGESGANVEIKFDLIGVLVGWWMCRSLVASQTCIVAQMIYKYKIVTTHWFIRILFYWIHWSAYIFWKIMFMRCVLCVQNTLKNDVTCFTHVGLHSTMCEDLFCKTILSLLLLHNTSIWMFTRLISEFTTWKFHRMSKTWSYFTNFETGNAVRTSWILDHLQLSYRRETNLFLEILRKETQMVETEAETFWR